MQASEQQVRAALAGEPCIDGIDDVAGRGRSEAVDPDHVAAVAMGAAPIGRPGWPLFAFSTASTARNLSVLMHCASISPAVRARLCLTSSSFPAASAAAHAQSVRRMCHRRQGIALVCPLQPFAVMQLGMVGLGRMGASMASRLVAAGHEVVAFDLSAERVQALVGQGAVGARSVVDLAKALRPPRAVWLMVPAAAVDPAIAALAPLLARDDILIDGGNSYYRDDLRRAATVGGLGIHYVDVGTSGGVWGQERGYCLMIGGEPEIVQHLDPIFAALAPGFTAAPRTPGRSGPIAPAERGYLHCGPHGAGHFVKMVHNGIEYGLMAAYAEGLNILRNANAGEHPRPADAETTPLRHPELYRYELDLAAIAEVWRRGSVIASWLLDLTAAALLADPELARFAGRVSDSGEGRWTLKAAIDEGVPAPILAAALSNRFTSRGEADFADRILSAMRLEFGGHQEKPR